MDPIGLYVRRWLNIKILPPKMTVGCLIKMTKISVVCGQSILSFSVIATKNIASNNVIEKDPEPTLPKTNS